MPLSVSADAVPAGPGAQRSWPGRRQGICQVICARRVIQMAFDK